jgi:serine/threonine protein phosphatase PrpC
MMTPSQPATPARSRERAGVAFSFNLPKIADQGEDADPVLHVRAGGPVIVGVFDGLGGSGSTRFEGIDGVRSSAYYGARVVRDAADDFLRRIAAFPDVTPSAIAAVLGEHIDAALQSYQEKWKSTGSSALRSSLFRRLPTTAAIAIARADEATTRITLLWAGDSRCYALTPTAGLQQLTADHLRTPQDALTNLTKDAPIANCISADAPARVDADEVTISKPLVLAAVTDGCFGYFKTPMHFEELLLDTMLAVTTPQGWSMALQERIAAVAGDDASLAVAVIGWRTHRAMRRDFRDRYAQLRAHYIAPLADATEPDAARAELWSAYAPTYEAHLRREGLPCTK